MRGHRLLQMLMLLQKNGKMSSAELAEALGVSRRTILRDAEVMLQSGVPLAVHQGAQGGFELLDEMPKMAIPEPPAPVLPADLGPVEALEAAIEGRLRVTLRAGTSTPRAVRPVQLHKAESAIFLVDQWDLERPIPMVEWGSIHVWPTPFQAAATL